MTTVKLQHVYGDARPNTRNIYVGRLTSEYTWAPNTMHGAKCIAGRERNIIKRSPGYVATELYHRKDGVTIEYHVVRWEGTTRTYVLWINGRTTVDRAFTT